MFGVANVVGQSSCSNGRSSTQAVTATLYSSKTQVELQWGAQGRLDAS